MTMSRIKRDPKKVALAEAILEAYQPKTVEDGLSTLFWTISMSLNCKMKLELRKHKIIKNLHSLLDKRRCGQFLGLIN